MVASDVGGHRELIRDGETGVLFRAGDAGALADATRAPALRGRALAATLRPGPPRSSSASARGRRASPGIGAVFVRLRRVHMTLQGLRIGLVGPLPPPAGGMAKQTRQLSELLQREGANVTIVQVNMDYRPRFVERVRGVRALVRLVPYIGRLWKVAGRTDLVHVMANSGWSWYLYAVPALCIARLRRTPSVLNYRGGEAETFLARSRRGVAKRMQRANVLVVPSGFLQRVFERYGMRSEVVPNIVDVDRFRPAVSAQ